ncbi:MAG: cell division protein ZapA [Ruminococcus sp.]|nr:cell division protein ZapA [Ruminococcus sp.]
MANKVTVTVCGKGYTLSGEETPEYTAKLAEVLDKKIKSMKTKFSSLSITDCAVLTALDCMDQLAKANQNIDNIRSQIKDYVDDAGRARNQANNSQREIRMLEEKVASLEKELRERTNYSTSTVNTPPMNAKDILSQDIEKAISQPAYPENGKAR